MKYEVKVQDRVVGTVEKSGRYWMGKSVYHDHIYHMSTRAEAERALVGSDMFNQSKAK
jgi:hypothetical protein